MDATANLPCCYQVLIKKSYSDRRGKRRTRKFKLRTLPREEGAKQRLRYRGGPLDKICNGAFIF